MVTLINITLKTQNLKKTFFIPSVLTLAILNASDIDTHFTEQELQNQIKETRAQEKILGADFKRTQSKLSHLKAILGQKGDIMLGFELCSAAIRTTNEKLNSIEEEWIVVQSILTDLKDEYESLTGSPFPIPPLLSTDPALIIASPLRFNSPHKLGAFTVTSAGFTEKLGRSTESLKREASHNSLAPITLDPNNCCKVTAPVKRPQAVPTSAPRITLARHSPSSATAPR